MGPKTSIVRTRTFQVSFALVIALMMLIISWLSKGDVWIVGGIAVFYIAINYLLISNKVTN